MDLVLPSFSFERSGRVFGQNTFFVAISLVKSQDPILVDEADPPHSIEREILRITCIRTLLKVSYKTLSLLPWFPKYTKYTILRQMASLARDNMVLEGVLGGGVKPLSQ